MTVEKMTADRVTSEYLRRCQADERLRSVMATSPLPESFQSAYDLLPRPFFADRGTMDALGTDVRDIFDIIVSLPERLFPGDLGAYCSALGIDEERTALIGRLRDAEPPRSGRADLYLDESGFKLLEFNVNTGLGGADMVEVYHALTAAESFSGFAREFHLEYTDIMASRAALLREAAAPVSGGREPVIAAIEADGGISSWENGFRSIQHSLARHGIQLVLGELGQLKEKNGRVYLDDQPIDLMLRYFMVDQLIADVSGQAVYDMICQVQEQGNLVLHTPPTSHLFNDKATLALLSDHSYRQSFSGAERELVDRMVPWTRVLREGWTRYEDERVDLMSFSIGHQQDLVLKPGAGFAGKGVVAGWETEADAWAELLRRSAGGPFIIQQRVDALPELVVDPDSGRLERILPAWGIFFSEHGYDGGFVRGVLPEGSTGVDATAEAKTSITGGPGTRRNGLFTFDAHEAVPQAGQGR
ncbi:hypothetical protein GXW83_08770 [Streptacidiphilus sp. PB12-B1b]|uniref:hypothetical protein n=1 Tax=Streptacidiphilus sp. PB12-B1b TaxID=2705012 RepID=UPI0015FA93C9|nr:hypothetical protein [Streptacidiphilus sp. PB12-B1b]QMU75821.1 hypothetical protein GXW83_08770 [Streptacidiphilus sp. PB12-B1b]